MIYIPILGAFALAVGTILQKVILRKRKIDIKLYQVLEFFGIVIASLPIIYFFWKLEPEALALRNILIFALVIFFSLIANILTYYSMKQEKVSNLEPAKLLEPLFTILLAVVFSFFVEGLYEKNLKIIIPALIAAGALIFSHIEKRHLEFNKYFIAAILGSFFFALELIISRLILDFYSPITFYFLRSSAILLFSFILFRPKFSKIDRKTFYLVLIIGAIWVAYRGILYYGYLHYGVVLTTLMIMLGPIFIYSLAWKFLKEKLNWKNIVASLIIVACVVYVLLD